MNNWTKKFFNEMYWELFMKRLPHEVQKEVDIIKQLAPSNVKNILDVCCGVGDIAAQLENDLGVQATGIEYSDDYVKQSYIKNMIHGDACIKQTDEKFSLVINWFTSFAYFSPQVNKKLLNNCYDYCDDTFLLESYNPYYIINQFKEEFNYERMYHNKKYNIKRHCTVNIEKRLLEQKWIFEDGIEYDTHTYLYFPDEIKELLLEVGFKKVEMMGRNNDKITQLNILTPRMIIKAEK